tara:strand:+ start:3396 stop:3761 length:366 start_codon:yes stop_codon:yes gene_type:complete
MNNERRYTAYLKAKTRVHKMYKDCKLSVRESAGFFIENVEGRNIIALRYPEMAFADNVMSAYINLDVVSHWNKTEDRNSRKFRNDVKSVCVVGDVANTSRPLAEYTPHNADWTSSDGQPEE